MNAQNIFAAPARAFATSRNREPSHEFAASLLPRISPVGAAEVRPGRKPWVIVKNKMGLNLFPKPRRGDTSFEFRHSRESRFRRLSLRNLGALRASALSFSSRKGQRRDAERAETRGERQSIARIARALALLTLFAATFAMPLCAQTTRTTFAASDAAHSSAGVTAGVGVASTFAARATFAANAGSSNAASSAGSRAEFAAALQPIGIFAAPQGTVGFGEAFSFVAHTSDPGECEKGNVEFNLTSATPKYCSAPNTWTPFASGGGGGGGTVSSVSCAALSPLFSCSVASATSTPAISFALTSAAGNTVYGNFSGTSGAPSFGAITAAMLPTSLTSNTSGNAATASALAATPTQCSGGQFAQGIAASGNANCATPAGSGTVNSGTQFAFGEYSAAGTAISSGPAPPAANGEYFCGYNVSAAAAVAPTCWLNSLAPRAVTGTTASDTIAYGDSIVEYRGSVAVATALPTPATLGNTGFYVKLINTTTGSATAVTVTAAGSYTFSSTGTGTLAIAQGQSCSLLVDPAGSVWDATCGDLPLSAGANISIARGANGPTISASSNAATATALAATPTQCSGTQFAQGIAASGNANCATPTAAAFNPAATTLFDDFMSDNALSALGWAVNGGGGSVTMNPSGSNQQFTNHPGIAELNSGGATNDWEYYILGGQNFPQLDPTANSFTIYSDVASYVATAAYPGTMRFGVFDTTSMNQKTPNTAAYFEEDGTGTSTAPVWQCVISNAGSATAVSSSVSASGGQSGGNTFHVLQIAFNSTTTPAFYIDGTQVCGSLSATMPTGHLQSIAFESVYNSGAAAMIIDYARIDWNLSR
jgi:hypothetical protein